MAFTLKGFSGLNAVCGNESAAREYILAAIAGKCDSVKTDVMGNLIAFRSGASAAKKLLVASNIDEPGFIVTDITDEGYVKFGAVGSIDPRVTVSKRVVIGADKIKGVIGMKAVHVTTREERETAVKLSELYIDIGAESKKKAQKRVRKGDYITFDTAFEDIGGRIRGKALDRFGSLCLIAAMKEMPAYDTYFVFSTQRETGGRGLRTAAFSIKPDAALIVDTVNTEDIYRSERVFARLGGGAVIEHMDRTGIADARFAAALAQLAEKHGIKAQNITADSSRTIAGAVNAAYADCVTAAIGIPCRYSHTPVCMMDKGDIDAASDLCAAIVKEGFDAA